MKRKTISIMKKKILSLCCCLLSLGATTLFAQQMNLAAGGEASGTGGTVSYSIGQLFYTPISGSTHNILQGVQQPYEISVLAVKEVAKKIELVATVFPNPTVDNFTLKVENNKFKNLYYELYDLNGQLLQKNKVESDETQIGIANLNSSYYILRVYDGNESIKTFKISKY